MSMPLTTYAADISNLHQKAQQHAATAIQCAMQAGQLLIDAKGAIEHGGWLSFVESTGLGVRTAQGYMKLAENAGVLNTQDLAHLGIEKALKFLAKPKSLPDDDFSPPEAGEYWTCNSESYFEFVWPYGDGKYHYLYGYPYFDKYGEEMGYPMIHITLKPVSWRGIRDRVSNIRKMGRSTGSPIFAMLWRDNCWLGSGHTAEEFYPNTITDTRRKPRYCCTDTGISGLVWSGADDWNERQDQGFKVLGLIFPGRGACNE